MDTEWNETYRVGLEILDEQHRALFEQISQIVQLIREEAERDRILTELQSLGRLVVGHLETEETLMVSLGYPGAIGHRRDHAEMVSAFVQLQRRVESEGATPELAYELDRRVSAWLSQHVRQSDRTFVAFLREQALERAERGSTAPAASRTPT